MFCKKCGALVKPEQKKCPSCGEPVPNLSYFCEWPKASTSQESVPKNFARQVLKDLDQIKKLARRTPRMLLAVSLVTMLCVLLILVQISSVEARLKSVNTKLTQLSIEMAQESEEEELAVTRTFSTSNLMLEQNEMLELFWDSGSVYFCVACQGDLESGISYMPLMEVSEDYGKSGNVRYIWTSEDGLDLTAQVDAKGVLTLREDYLERYISGNLTLRIQCSAIWTNSVGGSVTANVGYIVVIPAE